MINALLRYCDNSVAFLVNTAEKKSKCSKVQVVGSTNASRGARLEIEWLTLCSCVRTVEDVVVVPCGTSMGKTIRRARSKFVLGFAFQLPHVSQARLHDTGTALLLNTNLCRTKDG